MGAQTWVLLALLPDHSQLSTFHIETLKVGSLNNETLGMKLCLFRLGYYVVRIKPTSNLKHHNLWWQVSVDLSGAAGLRTVYCNYNVQPIQFHVVPPVCRPSVSPTPAVWCKTKLKKLIVFSHALGTTEAATVTKSVSMLCVNAVSHTAPITVHHKCNVLT